MLAAVLAVGIVCALWWLYFDVVAVVAEHRFVEATGAAQLRLARDSYALLHLPMIAGIVLFALGVKKVLEHTGDPLKDMPAVALCGGVALYLLAHVAFRLRNVGTVNVPRIVAAARLPRAVPGGDEVAGVAIARLLLGRLRRADGFRGRALRRGPRADPRRARRALTGGRHNGGDGRAPRHPRPRRLRAARARVLRQGARGPDHRVRLADVARLDLEAHVPRITSFWQTVLLGEKTYNGGAFGPHAHLHERVELKRGHFDRWLQLWFGTVESSSRARRRTWPRSMRCASPPRSTPACSRSPRPPTPCRSRRRGHRRHAPRPGRLRLSARAGRTSAVVGQDRGLLERGEVAAAVELVPVADVGEAPLRPAPRGPRDLPREDRAPGGHVDDAGPARRDPLATCRSSPSTGGPTRRRCRAASRASRCRAARRAARRSRGRPSQSVQAQNFSTIHAHWPAGESTSP